jgi:hypothetical protein
MFRSRGIAIQRAATVLVLTGALGCSPSGETYFVRYELWSDWEAVENPVGGCDGVANRSDTRPGATFSLIDSDGTTVSSTTIRSGYLDGSRWTGTAGRSKPHRVCAYDLRFENVPSLPSYRILWPAGGVSNSFTQGALAEYQNVPWRYEGTWTPD